MLTKKINLWENNETAFLSTYILDNSDELHPNKKRPAVIICPGGAYLATSDREAEPVALRFAAKGFHVFVLRYSCLLKNFEDFDLLLEEGSLPEINKNTQMPQPLYDLAKTFLIIGQHADEWHVDMDKIAICGFSAGAHLTASMGVHWHRSTLKDKFSVESSKFKPAALILGYPLIDYSLTEENSRGDEFTGKLFEFSRLAHFGEKYPSKEKMKQASPIHFVSENTPPTFIWHTDNDELVDSENSLAMGLALRKKQVPFEMHIFENGVHGLSLADEVSAGDSTYINEAAQAWLPMALKWLEKQNFTL
ncbi:alpha/beta hydrolase [Domibacillus robiginosus]|uniref:alpha/beta hydrolase n=1 Tax=Domibacillus robiginosus TaxID=1071054 RepID=UPI00067CD81C|nr:alpha/beta hydrolase [Domibacillus robiginosus]